MTTDESVCEKRILEDISWAKHTGDEAIRPVGVWVETIHRSPGVRTPGGVARAIPETSVVLGIVDHCGQTL